MFTRNEKSERAFSISTKVFEVCSQAQVVPEDTVDHAHIELLRLSI